MDDIGLRSPYDKNHLDWGGKTFINFGPKIEISLLN